MALRANLFNDSCLGFYINLHAEISEPHYVFRLFLTRWSTTRESPLSASSFYLILFSTVIRINDFNIENEKKNDNVSVRLIFPKTNMKAKHPDQPRHCSPDSYSASWP
jgi:hypothetical protein